MEQNWEHCQRQPGTGFTFAGWYLPQATAPISSDYVLTEDITLIAHWTQITYNVSFDAAGGSSVASRKLLMAM